MTGETHSAQTYVSAGYVALIANMNLPEIINSYVLDKYLVSTTNLNSQFEPAQVSIEIFKLKTPERIFRDRLWSKPDKFIMSKDEFYKLFQHDIYDDENEFFTWEKERKVFNTSFTTTDSLTLLLKISRNGKQANMLLL